MSDLALKFMLMVESRREVSPMEEFFEQRKDDFRSLDIDDKNQEVIGEHELVWTEHHAAYTRLVEEQLGIPEFLEENGCSEKELMASMAALLRKNPNVKKFVDSLLSCSDYDRFLQLAHNVKMGRHCFHVGFLSKS